MNDTLPSLPTAETETSHYRGQPANALARPDPGVDGGAADPRSENASRHRNALAPGTKLLWYCIERVLGHGAFGITYLANDDNLHRPVAIKEFLPGQLARREPDGSVQPLSEEFAADYRAGLASFVSEARTLAQLEHTSIVRVHNVFEANDTAYLVMQYEDGEGLDRILKRKRTLDEGQILRILGPLLAGLEYMHARGFVHRDIKPANVFIRRDGSPVLLDFGSARHAAAGESRTLTNFVSPGYAPIEQYAGRSDQQGPWSDIYGLGATLYRAMTGHAPPDAVSRSQALAQDTSDTYTSTTNRLQGSYSPALLQAVDRALEFRVQDRPQDIAVWRQELPPLTVDPSEVMVRVVDDQPTLLLTRAAGAGPVTGRVVARLRLRPLTAALGGLLLAAAAFAFYLNRASLVEGPNVALPAAPATAPPSPAPTVEATAGITGTPQPAEVPADQPSPSAPPAADPEVERGERIAALLAGARADLDAQRLTTPAGQNAYEKYREVLGLEPGQREAARGVVAISDRYLALCYREIERGEFARAESFLAKAEALTPQRPATATARATLEMRHEERTAKAAAQPPASKTAVAADSPPPKPPGSFFESLGKFFSTEPRPAPAPVEDRSEQFRQKLGGK